MDNSELTQKDGRAKKTANLEWQAPGGGGAPHKSDGDTRRLALGCLGGKSLYSAHSGIA